MEGSAHRRGLGINAGIEADRAGTALAEVADAAAP